VSRPIPSEDAIPYTAEVWVKFEFEIEADDDMQAEVIASYDWEEYNYRSTIEKIRVEADEEIDLDTPDPDILYDEMNSAY
jgi:hypothetical protein